MPSKMFIFGTTVLAVVIIIGGISWTLFSPPLPAETPPVSDNSGNEQPSTNPSETGNPDTSNQTSDSSSSGNFTTLTEEGIRDAAVEYIKSAHRETAQFLNDLEWFGGRADSGSAETELHLYHASDWAISIEWPLVENPAYNITASYNSEETLIVWIGTYQNGAIAETKYSNTKPTPAPSMVP